MSSLSSPDLPPSETLPKTEVNPGLSIADIEQRQEIEYQAFVDRGLQILNDERILRMDQGRTIVDLDRLKTMDWTPIRNRLSKNGKFGNRTKIQTLFYIFKNLKVISEEDNLAENPTPKPLFYIPESAEAALDVEKIRSADFYMGLWELQKPGFDINYPTLLEGLKSTTKSFETISAALTFHPRYGNGYRNEKGELIVRYQDGSERPITGEFFTDSHRYYGRIRRDPIDWFRPGQFLQEKCPRLLQKGLLRITDFRVLEGYTTKETVRSGPRTINEVGEVQMKGKRWYLGREYAGSNGYEALQLSDTYGGIYKKDGDQVRLVLIFKLKVDDESKITITGSARQQYAHVRDGGFEKYTPESFLNSLGFEHLQEHKEIIDNFQFYIKFAMKASEKAKMALYDLSLTEQLFAAKVYQEYGQKDEFWDFLKTYQYDGLRAMLCMYGSVENAQKVLEIASCVQTRRDIVDIKTLFKDIANIYTYTIDNIKGIDTETIKMIRNQVNILLLAALPVLRGNPNDLKLIGNLSIIDVGHALKNFGNRVERTLRQKGAIIGQTREYLNIINAIKEAKLPQEMAVLMELWLEESALNTIDPVAAQNLKQLFESNVVEFYPAYYPMMYSETAHITADTVKELTNYDHFIETASIDGMKLKYIEGLQIADLGSGNGERILRAEAAKLANPQIIGIDINDQPSFPPEMEFKKASVTNLPLENNSCHAVLASWSLYDDLTPEQIESCIDETARVLRDGGWTYIDVADPQGPNSPYTMLIEDFHKLHPELPKGTLRYQFADDQGKQYNKEFFFISEGELVAKLENKGFTCEVVRWQTNSGKPRFMVMAQIRKNQTSGQVLSPYRMQ